MATNGNLVIDLNNGGAIAGTGAGSIAGTLATKRTSSAGWHYIGAPLDGLTYANLNNNMTISKRNMYTYQENVVSPYLQVGWKGRSEGLTTLLTGQKNEGGPSDMIGYGLKYPAATTMTLSGTYQHGKTYNTGPMSFANSGVSSADGWHLISNPYPSYVDWNAATGWTKINISGPITYYNSATGMNIDYIPAMGGYPEVAINGGSPFIPPMQAFSIF